MIDKSHQGSGEPAVAGFVISPDDLSTLPFVPRAIYVGGSGDIAAMLFTGDIIVFTNAVAGTVLPLRVVKVFRTGTTATNLIGLY